VEPRKEIKIRSGRIKWTGHVTRMGDEKYLQNFSREICQGSDHLGDIGKVKSRFLTKSHAMKTYWGAEV
jgi:hypothetical protein